MRLPVGAYLFCMIADGCALGDPAGIAGATSLDGGTAIDASMPSVGASSQDSGDGDIANGNTNATGDSATRGLDADPGGGMVPGEGGTRRNDGQADGSATDPNLPSEPTIPPACATILAAKTSVNGFISDETNVDTARIQGAIDGCRVGQSVKLQSSGRSNAFLSGPLTMAQGITLWVDANVTLFVSRNPRDFDVSSGSCGTDANNSSSGCKPFISVSVPNAGIMGDGIIDGRGGEPMIGAGSTTWWDVAQSAKAAGLKHSNPTLIDVNGAQSFTLYSIRLYNSPMFHVVVGGSGFMIWGVSVLAPSVPTNSVGKALTAKFARNTDGIDPSG
ncbi:MAG: glycoside hydrolase family 28 protein, partial [Myxococcota bacterium]|nr:glycoside hydrolase family 28 protein [Myxococcota bacterium]